MPKIIELDPHVADLIAAGEVVERPASVVKELMENTIDAGAGIVTVEISAGGMTYIRVTDNGCGIAPEDAKTAFLRHATSKLRGAEGLEAIGTLGFRGEALAAIAAVSRIELLTREHGAREGVSLSLEAGEVRDISPAGCPEGTTIIVRDLFFNTPARLKFMKSDRAESSGIASTALRCALSRPEVSIRLIRDGKTEYHTPGDSRADSCIYSLFGREFSAGLLAADSSDESVAVNGFISSPSAARGNRSYQFFFVNGRPIRSLTLQAALERAYANALPSGRFPSCILYITTGFGNVDVNVHPTKTEVKFVSDKQVFDGVYYAAQSALARNSNTPGAFTGNAGESGAYTQSLNAPGLVDGEPGRLKIAGNPYPTARDSHAAKSTTGFKDMKVEEFRDRYRLDTSQNYNKNNGSGFNPAGRRAVDVIPDAPAAQPERSGNLPAPDEYRDLQADSPLSIFNAQPSIQLRVIGEALNTYIIVEYQNSLWLIDKHAAHERIHFDALNSNGFEPMSQALITPVICRHGYEGASLLLENGKFLDRLGFTVESFGDDAVAVRRIPAEIDIGETESALSEICAQLNRSGTAEPVRRDNIFRIIACKAAIKAGKSSGVRELEALAARVMSGEVSTCPHGRPVAFELSKTMLEKWFKRS